uniref:Uncharacterized protein n=1 Tax=Eptatretus burgeri TaxID=7764 RepID=A0A8C4QF22_EPTBU
MTLHPAHHIFIIFIILQSYVCCPNFVLRTVGWATEQSVGGFGEEPGVKSQLVNLIKSVRTLLRSKSTGCLI